MHSSTGCRSNKALTLSEELYQSPIALLPTAWTALGCHPLYPMQLLQELEGSLVLVQVDTQGPVVLYVGLYQLVA